MFELSTQEQIAFEILRKAALLVAPMGVEPLVCLEKKIQFKDFLSHYDLAWVTHKDTTYYCFCPIREKAPSNAVVKLIQAIFDAHKDLSFFILRQRIYTTAAEDHFSKAIVKTIAKSLSGNIQPQNHRLSLDQQFVEVAKSEIFIYQSQFLSLPPIEVPQKLTHEEALLAIQELAQSVPRGEVLHDFNRSIGVLILDEEGFVLAHATNSNSINKTLHAELVAVQSHYLKTQSRLPRNVKIYSTLKPCRMCAALLLHCCLDEKSLQVFYLENDPKQKSVDSDGRFLQIAQT